MRREDFAEIMIVPLLDTGYEVSYLGVINRRAAIVKGHPIDRPGIPEPRYREGAERLAGTPRRQQSTGIFAIHTNKSIVW
jgi:hypothetical protein